MLPTHIVHEVKRLLDQGGLSRREIARRVGVSRTTVCEIALGRRGVHGRETPVEHHSPNRDGPPVRCGGCGKLVRLPCVYCRTVDYLHRCRRLSAPATHQQQRLPAA